MNIVYFGTDVFLESFRYIADHHHILKLFTYHNDEDFFTEYGIIKEAESRGIPYSYEQITKEEIKSFFLEKECDLFFIAEYSSILDIPDDLPSFRGINIHSSLLPVGRSYYPIECAMERDCSQIGVTMHKLISKLDAGDILFQKSIENSPEIDSIDVYLRFGAFVLEMTKKLFADPKAVFNAGIPQKEHLPYWKRPATELLTLSHEMTYEEAKSVYRKFNSMTEVVLNGTRYFVKAMMYGKTDLPKNEWILSDTLALYGIRDGHLRLVIHPSESNHSNTGRKSK